MQNSSWMENWYFSKYIRFNEGNDGIAFMTTGGEDKNSGKKKR